MARHVTAGLLLVLAAMLGTTPSAQDRYPFQDPSMPTEARVGNILSLMTLDEKLAVLRTGGINVPRLGIKGTGIGEALSGVVQGGGLADLVADLLSDPKTLAYWDDAKSGFVVEEEPVSIMLDGSSADVRVERTVKITR